MKGISYRGNRICFGRYALQALEPAWITSRQIEAGRRAMTRNVRRGGKIWVRIFPDKPVTVREAVPNTLLERSEVIRAVIVRTRKELKRDNGMIIRYDDNAAVVIDQEGNPKGTRIFGAIARELRQLNFTKIVSLAPEVL
ncbi:hypothetical protein PVK06_034086 [Gossypium arboreum]|uniref:50S ribosomal protein L14, chloroplastic n=1 Tax=Gossypium arboreum TaxID=29729 RepID=A0ABR0ND80_GOSAR|nr:hypothetical protein PVK06_034086 [Gossypium arboreum]